LDHAQVGATFEQVGRERVAKRVRVHVAESDPTVEEALDVARRDPSSAPVDEQSSGGREIVQYFTAAVVAPPHECVDARSMKRHDPLLAALAQHAHDVVAPGDVVEI
jgi:nitroreductase